MKNHFQRQHLASASGICAILLWSLTVALARRISEQLGPINGATSVYVVASILSIARIISSKKKRQEIVELPRIYLLGCGFLFMCYMLFLFLAVGLAANRNQVLEVGLVNYLWPALTLVFSVLILGNSATWLLFPGTLLALSGIFLVLTSTSSITWHSFSQNLASNPAAFMLGAAAAFSWGLYSTLTRKWAGGSQGGAVVVFLPVTTFALFLISLFIEEPGEWNTRVSIEVLTFGVATFLAYSMWDSSMRMGNIVFVAASSYLTPFLSTVVASIYLSAAPTSQLWIGCGILVAGSILSWTSVSDNNPLEPEQRNVPTKMEKPRH